MKMRGIKPSFWVDGDVVEVSPYARLLFIGLWQMACDNGHVKDRPRQIKLSILPADAVVIEDLLDELSKALIARAGGWITIPNLSRHQRIDRRYFLTCDHAGCTKPPVESPAGNEPEPAGNTTGPRRGHDVHPLGPRDEGEGEGEGEGEYVLTSGGDDKPTEIAESTPTPKRTRNGTRLPADFIPSETARQTAITECPEIDLRREHAKFVDYWTAAPGAKGVKADWDATWRNWMRRAAEDATRRPRSRQQETDDLFAAAQARAAERDMAAGRLTPIRGALG